jgi:hypothetical protein
MFPNLIPDPENLRRIEKITLFLENRAVPGNPRHIEKTKSIRESRVVSGRPRHVGKMPITPQFSFMISSTS